MSTLVPALRIAAAVPATLTPEGRVGTGESVLLAVVAVVTLLCGIGLLTARRAVSAAVNMIAIMICLATLYIANEAPFLGITQVVVYTGAVMTLVLFVIMLVGVGGDEPVSAPGRPASKWLVVACGLGLAAVLTAAVWRSVFPAATNGLADGANATPADLAMVLFGEHVVTMELTGCLLVIAALGALTLTHRERIRPKVTQRRNVADKMRAYAERGAHPGQKPMSGVYASTNSAAAPALDAAGEVVEASIPRVLRVRGTGLGLAEVSPERAADQRAGRAPSTRPTGETLSGMPAMPGAAAPVVQQPLAPAHSPALEVSEAQGDTQDKEEEK